jgi:hypothetical protein
MKINDGLISIKDITVTDDNTYIEFWCIKFPNIIVNSFKNGSHPKIDLYIHHKKYINQNIVCTIKYDAVVLAPVSRKNFLERCKHYMFNSGSGLVCMVSMGLYGYKYTTQLMNGLGDEFRPFYFPEMLVAPSVTTDNQMDLIDEDDMSIII